MGFNGQPLHIQVSSLSPVSDRTDQQVDAPTRTPRAEAVVVLILGLCALLRLLFGEDGTEAQELAEVHVAREVPW